MQTATLLTGIVLGFSIAAPVGPIGVLCIRRTLADGRLHGFVSGLGAATADAFYGAIAGFGLTAISTVIVSEQLWLRLGGGVFLLYLGLKTVASRPSERPAKARGRGLLGAYASTLVLTLTNPMTILSFVAIFAGLGLGSSGTTAVSALTLVLGVFLGSALWWLCLSSGVGVFRRRLDALALRWVNVLSGAVVSAFGVAALLSVIGLTT